MTQKYFYKGITLLARSLTVPTWVDSGGEMAKICKELLASIWPCEPTRLMGIKLSNLAEKSEIETEKLITDFAKPTEKKVATEEEKEKVIVPLSQTENLDLPKKRPRSDKVDVPPSRNAHRKIRRSKGNQKDDDEDIVKLDFYFAKKADGNK